MKKNGNVRMINLIMLALLLVVIWVAYQRINLVLKYRAEKKEKAEIFTAHVIDEKHAALIKHARQVAEKSELLSHLTAQEREQIAAITHQIADFEQQYLAPVSPAVAFLGPIGTANIVLKEQTLEREIAIKLNDLGAILHHHFALQHKGPFEPADDLPTALIQVEHLLKHRRG
jgi:hypothetical protein